LTAKYLVLFDRNLTMLVHPSRVPRLSAHLWSNADVPPVQRSGHCDAHLLKQIRQRLVLKLGHGAPPLEAPCEIVP